MDLTTERCPDCTYGPCVDWDGEEVQTRCEACARLHQAEEDERKRLAAAHQLTLRLASGQGRMDDVQEWAEDLAREKPEVEDLLNELTRPLAQMRAQVEAVARRLGVDLSDEAVRIADLYLYGRYFG